MAREKTIGERKFQERFVREMEKYRWQAPDQLDGNKRRVTVDDLIDHWRGELNRINADQLEGVPLTDREFAQVMSKVNGIENSFEAAKILAMEGSTGKIDGIYRDKDPRVTREQLTLTIFKKAEIRGGDSSYKIAREVESPRGNRFDLVLLINGLPLINIEQKRADKSLEEAFGQFKRYYREGEYINNFMAFSQMMVINSEVATKYFATPKSLEAFNPSFVFSWADRKNTPINHWEDIVANFLMIPMAHQMVGDYLIIEEAEEPEDRKHMIMRPYQVYALQAIEGAALGWDNEDRLPHGGFVWHTTGSGKTITSFKTALFLSTRGGFDKVVFLVDRKDLDTKTTTDFKAYAAYESVSVDDTKHSHELRKKLLSPRKGIVITSIQKLSILVKDLVENGDYDLAGKKIVFIIDEAHRTNMGEMMASIRDYFKREGLFFGFTGTPLFDENEAKGMVNERSELIDTTEKLFGPELHRYTIDQAINDGNVLGFHIDYINTGEFLGYEDLREDILAELEEERPQKSKRELERMVGELSDLELEKEAKKRKLLVYHDESHIERVVEEILANWEEQSQSRFFNAILTVGYRDRVVAYYEEFKRQLEDWDDKPNIAMTFSFGGENELDNSMLRTINNMFKDYEKITGVRYSMMDISKSEDAYFKDIVARASRGGSARNEKNIDLIIVADQLLTGYDSRYLNTLYVDRELELHNLIQAYSRTNRIFGREKEFGTIINFQYPKITEEKVNRALRLYGSGGESSRVIVEDYTSSVADLSERVEIMLDSLEDPSDWEGLNESRRDDFVSAFKRVNEKLNQVMQYYEYSWDRESFGMDEHLWNKYIGAYRNLMAREDKEEELLPSIPLVGRTKLASSQLVDGDHILSLIGSQIVSEEGFHRADSETLRLIYEEIQELSDLGEDQMARMLREFVETELEPGRLSSSVDFDTAFNNWKEAGFRRELEEFSRDWGIDKDILYSSYRDYSPGEAIPYLDDISSSVDFKGARKKMGEDRLDHIMALNDGALSSWMNEMKKKYK